VKVTRIASSRSLHAGKYAQLAEQARRLGVVRAELRSVAQKAVARGGRGKADRIARHNLGTIKRDRRDRRDRKWQQTVRSETFRAVPAGVDKARTAVAEDLTKTFTGRKPLGRNLNRHLAAWTKGVTAEALQKVSERRSSALVVVNAAYTSQIDHRTGLFGVRKGDRLHCPRRGRAACRPQRCDQHPAQGK
jgi:hypothetical protein